MQAVSTRAPVNRPDRAKEMMEACAEELPLERATELLGDLLANVASALRGKPQTVRHACVALISRGHLLIEDVPGVGKTTLARALSHSVEADFHRIQFTSDLLPGDLTGFSIPEIVAGRPSNRFVFQPGPLFANIVLADEVNRASPKSQSALLEAMSEQTVSVDGITHPLPDPFFVVATQNPLEHVGTHPLPESQLDRFLMRISIGYPSPETEAELLCGDPAIHALAGLRAVLDLDALRAIQRLSTRVKFADSLVAYLLEIVGETRQHEALELGVSPRGALALRRAAQSLALFDGRDYCIPEDVQELALPILAHRLSADLRSGVRPGDEETSWALSEILERVPVPL